MAHGAHVIARREILHDLHIGDGNRRFVISDGGDKPYRVKVRGPFYATFQTLTPLLEGVYIADAVAIAGSMDGCPSESDR